MNQKINSRVKIVNKNFFYTCSIKAKKIQETILRYWHLHIWEEMHGTVCKLQTIFKKHWQSMLSIWEEHSSFFSNMCATYDCIKTNEKLVVFGYNLNGTDSKYTAQASEPTEHNPKEIAHISIVQLTIWTKIEMEDTLSYRTIHLTLSVPYLGPLWCGTGSSSSCGSRWILTKHFAQKHFHPLSPRGAEQFYMEMWK